MIVIVSLIIVYHCVTKNEYFICLFVSIINEIVILVNCRMICEFIIVLLNIPEECSFYVCIHILCVSVQWNQIKNKGPISLAEDVARTAATDQSRQLGRLGRPKNGLRSHQDDARATSETGVKAFR